MRILICWAVFCLLISKSNDVIASPEDLKLARILESFQIQECQMLPRHKLTSLGKRLFESTLLSGDNDVSCATCHLEKHGFADGLAMAIGVGGKGEGEERLYDGKGTLVQRNAFTLFDRGRPGYNTFFWDGKVDADESTIYSPFGNYLSPIFRDALSVAAILPLTERDEFLGQLSVFNANEYQEAVGDSLYQRRYELLSKAIRERIAETDLGKAFDDVGISPNELELAHIGNALAAFIRDEFSCPDTPWNRFLAGDSEALSNSQKQGAIVFFGKGRCVGCHQPPFFSDLQFHSIGVPQGEFGPNPRKRDIGRANVTNKGEDLNLFKTPSLIAVSRTAPYGHNGIFDSLEEVIVQHVNPLEWYVNNRSEIPSDRLRITKYLDQRSPYLQYIEITENDLNDLLDFLEAL